MHIGVVQKKILLKSYSSLYKKNTSGMPIIDTRKSTCTDCALSFDVSVSVGSVVRKRS